MDVEQILEELRYVRADRRFPREAVKHAIAARREITPHFLSILEDTRTRYRELAEDEGYMAHLYATYLLAQFREPRAYPLLVDLFSLPIDALDKLVGDLITENLGRILASVCAADTTLIAGMIENEDLDEWVRGAALGALLSLVAAETLKREEVIADFTELFRDKLARRASQVWNALVSAAADLGAVRSAAHQQAVEHVEHRRLESGPLGVRQALEPVSSPGSRRESAAPGWRFSSRRRGRSMSEKSADTIREPHAAYRQFQPRPKPATERLISSRRLKAATVDLLELGRPPDQQHGISISEALNEQRSES